LLIVADTLDELSDELDLPNEKKDKDEYRRLAEVTREIVGQIDPRALRIDKKKLKVERPMKRART